MKAVFELLGLALRAVRGLAPVLRFFSRKG